MAQLNLVNRKKLTALSSLTTSLHLTTTLESDAIDCTGYRDAIFITRVVANSTIPVPIYLDGSVDGVTYVQYATVHPDFTTTANNVVTKVTTLPPYVKTRVPAYTTTTYSRFSCKVSLMS